MSLTKDEYLWGAEAIGKEINRKPSQVYHIAATHPQDIAGLRKIGAALCLHIPTFRKSFAETAEQTKAG